MPRKPVLTDLSHGPIVCSYRDKTVKLLAINRDPKCTKPYYVHTGNRVAWVDDVAYTDPVYDADEDVQCKCETCIVTARVVDFLSDSLNPVDAADCLCRLVEQFANSFPPLRPVLRDALREALKRKA